MELTCTKKLLEYIDVKPEKMPIEVDPLFEWTANLLVINRRKTIVVVHVASRCSFVLHGMTVKHLKKLPEWILCGVRNVLESEYVRSEIIEQYLNDLGREVSFWANSSRKVVASCNKACERVEWCSDLLEPENLLQQSIQLWMNDDMLSGRDYLLAYQTLVGQLQERYGENIRSCRALELEVSLELNTPCKRRIIVPDNLSFYQFHNVLQDCFGWKDCHLHQFVVEVDTEGFPTNIIQPDWEEFQDFPGVQTQSSTAVTLKDVFSSRMRIVYEYDFGDGWIHTIELCCVIADCRETYPHCILAVGDAPMEDCGGPEGFAHVMEVLQDKNHPEYREISEWVRSTWWQPLDVNRINRFLKYAHRKRVPIIY